MSNRRRWLVPAALLALAVAVRAPGAVDIPAPTDETDELLWALGIVRDGDRPLTASDPYLGPLAAYVTAVAFAVAGPSFEAGRAAAAVLGALAAPAAWALGYVLGGPAAGLVAGLALAVGFGPVVVGSHVAWSHGTAPAFFALGLAALIAGARETRRERAWQFAAGLLLALAFAAHPTVVALLPGVCAWWVVAHRGEPSRAARRALFLALGAIVGYLPGLLSLARNGIAPLAASAVDRDYVGPVGGAWPAGFAAWLGCLARNVAGPAVQTSGDARMWFFGALLLGAVVAAAAGQRRSEASGAARAETVVPLAVVLSGAVAMPLVLEPDKFTSLTGLRYAMPALPVAAAALGVVIARTGALVPATQYVTDAPGPEASGDGARGPTASRVVRAAGLAIVAVLAIVPLVSTARFYRAVRATGVTGAPVRAMVAALAGEQAGASAATPHAPVLIDSALDVKLAGGGEVGRAAGALLELRGVPHTKARLDKIRWYVANPGPGSVNLILSGDSVDALEADARLEPVLVVPVVPGQASRSGSTWGWYRTIGRTD